MANSLYESIKSIAEKVTDNFLQCDPNSIWDLFMVDYDTTFPRIPPRNTNTESTAKSFPEMNSKSYSLEGNSITNIMLIVLNYQGKACEEPGKEDECVNNAQGNISITKIKQKNEKKEFENLSSAFKSMKEDKFSNRLQTVNNILKKLESGYFREKFEKEEDKFRGTSNLPFSYVVEMIKDINDVLSLYRDNLCEKVANTWNELKP